MSYHTLPSSPPSLEASGEHERSPGTREQAPSPDLLAILKEVHEDDLRHWETSLQVGIGRAR